jgi:hypothetical protein
MEFTSGLLARHEIVHWLDYGSLLGAVREGSLIPWDPDADFGILRRQQTDVLALAGEFEAAGHPLDTSLPGVIKISYSDVNASPVDLLLWEQRDGLLHPILDEAYAWPGMASREAFPESFLTPPGEVSLHGRRFPAPRAAHEFLRDHRYGPHYATPTRPIRSVRLYPKFDIEDATPEVEGLLARISEGDLRLAQLRSRARWSRHRAVELWQKAGLPIAPDARRVRAVLAQANSRPPTAAVEDLAESVALVEQAVEELERRSPALAVRRAGRRARRATEIVLARVQRRPHRAGFPFGVTSLERPA